MFLNNYTKFIFLFVSAKGAAILATKAAAVKGAVALAAKGAAMGGNILSAKAAALNSLLPLPIPYAVSV